MLGLSQSSPRLGQWEVDIVRVLASGDFRKLQDGVDQSLDTSLKAYDLLNLIEDELNELKASKREIDLAFQPMSEEARNASAPLAEVESVLRTGIRDIAALDVLFFEQALAFSSIGNSMRRAGLGPEAASIANAAQQMRNWRTAVAQRLYPRMDAAFDEREAVEQGFYGRLASQGLRHILDSDKPGYFEALGEAIAQATGVATESPMIGMSGYRLGADPVSTTAALYSLIKVAVIAAAIVYSVNKLVNGALAYFESSTKILEFERAFQERKTIREQAVARGTITPSEAIAANDEDRKKTDEEVKKALEEAKRAWPSLEEALKNTLFYGVIPVVGSLLLLKLVDVI